MACSTIPTPPRAWVLPTSKMFVSWFLPTERKTVPARRRVRACGGGRGGRGGRRTATNMITPLYPSAKCHPGRASIGEQSPASPSSCHAVRTAAASCRPRPWAALALRQHSARCAPPAPAPAVGLPCALAAADATCHLHRSAALRRCNMQAAVLLQKINKMLRTARTEKAGCSAHRRTSLRTARGWRSPRGHSFALKAATGAHGSAWPALSMSC